MVSGCWRSLTSSCNHLTRRLHPSFAHIIDRDNRDSIDIPNPPALSSTTHRRCHASASARRVPNFGGWRNPSFSLPLGLALCLLWSYSSSAEESNEIGYIKDVAEVLSDTSVEFISATTTVAPAPFPGEIAAAAADSFLPVAALQHLIDAVHSFSSLNWWASIALTTVLIRGATIPFC